MVILPAAVECSHEYFVYLPGLDQNCRKNQRWAYTREELEELTIAGVEGNVEEEDGRDLRGLYCSTFIIIISYIIFLLFLFTTK